MPNEVPGAPANPDTNTLPTQPTSASNGSDNNNSPSYVSKADFDALMKRVNEQSGIITQLRKATKSTETAQEPTEPTSQPTRLTAADKALDARLKKAEEREERQRARAKTDTVRTAARAAGIPDDRLTHFERFFASEEAAKQLKWNEEKDTVDFVDEYDRPADLAGYIKGFLGTPSGQIFQPAPTVGNIPRKGSNQPAGTKSFMDYTPSELAKLPDEQQRALLNAQRA